MDFDQQLLPAFPCSPVYGTLKSEPRVDQNGLSASQRLLIFHFEFHAFHTLAPRRTATSTTLHT
jgi:hypothetical protein